jgi:putative endonuclease
MFAIRSSGRFSHGWARPTVAVFRMAGHNDFGAAAETCAARLLESRGWRILHRNWRWRHKEIDLVARRGDLVAFVEVRARRTARYGHPLETIGPRKRREIEAAAAVWIARHGRPGERYRFDAIAVLDETGMGAADARLDHVEDAWRC